MDEEKLCRAVDWLRSVLTREIRTPIEKFELSDIGQHHYRLSFEMNGAEKVFPMAETYVEGIADASLLRRQHDHAGLGGCRKANQLTSHQQYVGQG